MNHRRIDGKDGVAGSIPEEIGLTGEHLGNLPHAFTHLPLINAAITLDHQLDHGPGRDPVQ